MEEPVLTPFQFFNLDKNLQRKIMIEDLSLESINNLCKGAQIMSEEFKQKYVAGQHESVREKRMDKASNFLNNLCNNVEVWRAKFHYEFPRSYRWVEDTATKNNRYEDFRFWSSFYRSFEKNMQKYNADFLKAVRNNNLGEVQKLLSLGVDPNIRDKYGDTALILGSDLGYLDVVEKLLAAGAEVDARDGDGDGKPALIWASSDGHFEIVEKLLAAGADVNARDRRGNTALMEASREGNLDVVEKLLVAGADVNARDDEGQTALMKASYSGRSEIVNRLAIAGANINAQDNEKLTALMMALLDYKYSGEEDLATIFTIIKYKPDPDIQNIDGKTAVDIAEELGLDSVVDALLYLRRKKRA